MKNPKILIIGTGDLRNYGCEAIVHGTFNIIKNVLPDAKIYLASDDFAYDSSVIPKDINLIKYKRRFSPRRIFYGILRRVFHIGQGSEVRMNTNIGKKYDVVLSCGGDNYCERPDHGIYNLLVDLMKIGDKTVKANKKYFLWGASVGPFHNKDIEDKVISNLAKCEKIFVRENLSFDYLSHFKQITPPNLKIVADPAFQMSPAKIDFERKPDKVYIGFNMSLLAIGHSFNDGECKDWDIKIATQLNKLLKDNPNFEIYLIPHVVMTGAQDDMNCLRPIYEMIDEENRAHLIEPGLGARRTKALISNMDLLIAARMHCCVAGISSDTPTLFITYSNKGKGMSHYAYGHHEYEITCVDLLSSEGVLQDKIEGMLNLRKEIQTNLKTKSINFNQNSMRAGLILKTSLKNEHSFGTSCCNS